MGVVLLVNQPFAKSNSRSSPKTMLYCVVLSYSLEYHVGPVTQSTCGLHLS